MVEEIKIKNNITRKVRDNRLSMNRTTEEREKADLQYREYHRESRKLLDFCERNKKERYPPAFILNDPVKVLQK